MHLLVRRGLVRRGTRGRAGVEATHSYSLNAAAIVADAEGRDERFVRGTQSIQGVDCSEFGPQRDYAALLNAGATVARLAPRFAWKFWMATPLELASAGVLMCAGWPNEASNPPHRLPPGGSYPNVMVANATYDPPTPLINAV
jgi:TAP-like protein